MLLLWGSLAAGLAGLAYVLLKGLWQCAARTSAGPLTIPLAATLSLLLPAPLFFTQSFLQLGDRTAASLLLAATTGILTLAIAWGLWRAWQRRRSTDFIALAAVIQFLAVLAAWGLIPLRLWH